LTPASHTVFGHLLNPVYLILFWIFTCKKLFKDKKSLIIHNSTILQIALLV
jgi:hypothetical protein